MGDPLSKRFIDRDYEYPGRTVFVSAFFMAKHETTKELWDDVRAWGLDNGYTDLAAGGAKEAQHPVDSITWYDMLKWCNARSEMEGLAPCYTVSGSIMRTGADTPDCNWHANGYRLPTEAEWEKAARGGVSGKSFPWGGDTISHSQANYRVHSTDGTKNLHRYDVSPTRGYHPTYAVGGFPYTSPVASFGPNGYGLYDMAGNIWEMCWDWHGSYAAGSRIDPVGLASGTGRVMRGGNWAFDADKARCSYRSYNSSPGYTYAGYGFRTVRRQERTSPG
jgi:formylglycine-generating enzyme required for sulfatase activity